MEMSTEHYVFHYRKNSLAEKEIDKIAAMQEGCYAFISGCLHADAKGKIHYRLFDTPQEVGKQYAIIHGEDDDEPCNGFALPDIMSKDGMDHVYAVYSETIKCVGFHEDAHIISYSLCRPDSRFISEGLAMFFDRYWWGIDNYSWTRWYIEQGKNPSVADLIDNSKFREYDCELTYPLAGAFTGYLLERFGTEKYVEFYKRCADETARAFEQTFGRSVALFEKDFLGYMKMFALRQDIRELLMKDMDQ